MSKPETLEENQSIEQAARAMATNSGWDRWDSAATCQHTPNGNEPHEEREYWLELARIAFAHFKA